MSRKWVAGPIVSRELEPRSFHAACSVGRHFVVVGGRGRDNQHFADVHLFDTGRLSQRRQLAELFITECSCCGLVIVRVYCQEVAILSLYIHDVDCGYS